MGHDAGGRLRGGRRQFRGCQRRRPAPMLRPAITAGPADATLATATPAVAGRLRARRRARPRRDGRRLPGAAGQSRPHGGAEDDPARVDALAGRPGPLSHRGRKRRPARPSGHRADLRSRPARGPAVLHDEVRRRHDAGAAPGRRADAAARSRGPVGADLPGDPFRPRARRAAPRPEAVEHSDRRGRPPARHRFRPGQARGDRPTT